MNSNIDANDISLSLQLALPGQGGHPMTDDFVKRVMADDPITGKDISAKVAALAAMDEADYMALLKPAAVELNMTISDLRTPGVLQTMREPVGRLPG